MQSWSANEYRHVKQVDFSPQDSWKPTDCAMHNCFPLHYLHNACLYHLYLILIKLAATLLYQVQYQLLKILRGEKRPTILEILCDGGI